MFGVIFLLLLVVPIVELYVIVQVSGQIGILWTIVSLIAISTIGAWLVRREGSGIIDRIRNQLFGGNLPSKEIADGALIMFGGTLLLTPGFFTDAIGLGLLIPPVRAVVRNVLMARWQARRAAQREAFAAANPGAAGSPFGPGGFTVGFGTPDGARVWQPGRDVPGRDARPRRDVPRRDVIDVDVTRADSPTSPDSPSLEA